MRLSTKRRTSADDVRKVVLGALATALDDSKEEAKRNILGLNAARLFDLEVPPAKSGKKVVPQPVAVPAE